MINCVFDEVLENNAYVLKCGAKRHNVVLEFVGVDKPCVSDRVLMHEELLNKASPYYSQPYAFVVSGEVLAHEVKERNMVDFIVLGVKNQLYVLKRIYG